MTMKIRRSSERGHVDHGWLESFHTFSFADYYDPAHMGFRSLRVINEDRVQPGRGFGTHPHRDMEIISYVLDGQLAHRDSLGTGSIIKPGDVQRMSAGTGVTHSEFNPSETALVHFLQIWILPDRGGHQPSYEQKAFPAAERQDRLRLVASPDGREGSLTIHQDANLFAGLVASGKSVRHERGPGRHTFVHLCRGRAKLDGQALGAGDSAAIPAAAGAAEPLVLAAEADAEVLVFDLG